MANHDSALVSEVKWPKDLKKPSLNSVQFCLADCVCSYWYDGNGTRRALLTLSMSMVHLGKSLKR